MIKDTIVKYAEEANKTKDRSDKAIIGITADMSRDDSHHCHDDNNNHRILDKIFQVVKRLEENEKNEFRWFKSQEFATKNDLKETERKIMSKISEFADRQNAFNDKMDVAITGVTGDVKTLNDLIAELQATQGAITAEDQALLDQIEVRAVAITTKLEALDALTPPPVVV